MELPGRMPLIARALVLDTNIVLDLFVFQDLATEPLRQAMGQKKLRWIASAPMRDELARVLTYPQIARSMLHHAVLADDVLANFDVQATMVAVAPKASLTCKDPDDQKFIDLAVTHKALLLSKDNAVLCMKKRLLAQEIHVQNAIE